MEEGPIRIGSSDYNYIPNRIFGKGSYSTVYYGNKLGDDENEYAIKVINKQNTIECKNEILLKNEI